jgi:flagellar hook-length control protein FliK
VQSDTASTLATTGTTQASTSTFRAASTKDTAQGAAKNTTVSRQSFEESKPLLLKAGLSDKEITDLSARVQAGTLTWGQLVQTIGTHTTGAKKSVSLSADDAANLQTMFQKLGFSSDDSASMVKSVSQGDGLKVLSSIQTKLNSTAADSTPGLNSGELSTFFKALNLPGTTAATLTQKLAGDKATVADMSTALAAIGQTMQEQRAKSTANDADVAKGLSKIMDKDVAKNTRDTTGATSTSSSGGQVRYDLKTKDKDDTSWFNEHEQNQQKASDDAWRNFNNKVRTDGSATQQSASATATNAAANAAAAATGTSTGSNASAGTSAGALSSTQASAAKSGSLDAALTRAAQAMATPQGKADTTQQTATFENVTAPKVLDQVTQAMLKDLGQGRRQLTMELAPENLGKVQVMLQVKGKEVSAVISAEDSSTAAMLNSNMDGLKKSLEDKGLTVQHMEVQTGLASRQDQQASFNAEQHNQQAQEQQDMTRIFSQLRAMRSDSGDALDMQNANMQAILADQGLHIIA